LNNDFLLLVERIEAAEREAQHAKESAEMSFEVIRALKLEALKCIETATKDTQTS
jgi:hypothetical protein